METSPAGDRKATAESRFRAIFDGELSYVWTTLFRLGVRASDVEDVTHEVFLNVFKRIEDFDASRPLRPWIFGFAYRGASDYRRLARHRREVLSPPAEDIADPSLSADEELSRRERQALLNRALDTVPLERRAVFVLHEWEGRSIPEVAEILDLPLNTAYSRLRIAREEITVAVKRICLSKKERA